MRHAPDLAGLRYGDLLVIAPEGAGRWLCRCDCGNVRSVHGRNLPNGNTRSCGAHRPRSHADATMTAYKAAHRAVRTTRGRASANICARCHLRRADAWALAWARSTAWGATIRETQAGYCYSTDPRAYDPLCNACHRSFDRAVHAQRLAEAGGTPPLWGDPLPPLRNGGV